MSRSVPRKALALLAFSLATSLVPAASEKPCSDIAGSCVIDKSCPAGATCQDHRCVCDPGSCAVGSWGPILGKCVAAVPSNNGPSQPVLSPESWFLTEAEITQGRHGHYRGSGNIATYTRGNRVHAFAEGKDFEAELYDELTTTQEGDVFHTAGWLVGPYWQLRPDLDMKGLKNTTYGAVLTEAAKRNVEILGLFWRNVKPLKHFASYREIDSLVSLLKDVDKSRGPNASRVEAYMDARCESPTGSIHQKFFSLTRKGHQYSKAWIGGIDIAEKRWDVIGSNTTYPVKQEALSKLREAEAGLSPVLRNGGGGWHDTELAIEGPAATDIVATFVERWNEQHCDLTTLHPFLQSPPKPTRIPAAVPPNATIGTAAVQVLRTYSCSYARHSGCMKSFAPYGETSILDGLLKAVRTAQYFIYIEDQYFYWMEPLYAELREALRSRVGHVILLVQWPQEIPGSSTWLWKFWRPLFQEFPNQVHAFYRKGGVYIHSKTKVFDDTWVMSGSANINYRSHTSDHEAVATVVDEGARVTTPEGYHVSAWAREFRCRLFEDNTGIPASVFQGLSIDDAVKRWYAAASEKDSRIGAFQFDWGKKDSENIPQYASWSDNDLVRGAADPDDRCSGTVAATTPAHTEVLV